VIVHSHQYNRVTSTSTTSGVSVTVVAVVHRRGEKAEREISSSILLFNRPSTLIIVIVVAVNRHCDEANNNKTAIKREREKSRETIT
jgi:hypothetical protein